MFTDTCFIFVYYLCDSKLLTAPSGAVANAGNPSWPNELWMLFSVIDGMLIDEETIPCIPDSIPIALAVFHSLIS